MPTDRLIEPEQIAGIIRGWLTGEIDDASAALKALRLAGSMDRILGGHRTEVVVEAYWELRRLAESGTGKPDRSRMKDLLEYLEGRRRHHEVG